MLNLNFLPRAYPPAFDGGAWETWVYQHSGEPSVMALSRLALDLIGAEALAERDYYALRLGVQRALEHLSPSGLARLSAYNELAPDFDAWFARGGDR